MCAPELGSGFPVLVVSEHLVRDDGGGRCPAQAEMGTRRKEIQAGPAPPQVGQC